MALSTRLRTHLVTFVGVGVVALSAMSSSALAAGDATNSACPNEGLTGFSAALPDCRAYELVTPSYTASAPEIREVTLATDGEAAVVQNFGVFAGAPHDTALSGEAYALRRTGNGWAPEALGPPSEYFGGKEYKAAYLAADANGSDGASLWTFPDGPNLAGAAALRSTDGEFTEIGPYGFEAASRERNRMGNAEGASPSLNAVIIGAAAAGFESESSLWPGDATSNEHRSLYVYAGSNRASVGGEREPELVGVEDQHPLSGVPHINEGAHLVSACGTVLGSSASEYNAVAENGSETSIFFTAEHNESCTAHQPDVSELLDRINEERTVNLSEPTTPAGVCAPSQPCESAPAEPATFQGASTDGQIVYFTSEQPLVTGAPLEGVKLYAERVEHNEVMDIRDVSSDPVEGQSPRVLGVARISADGNRTYFVAESVLAGENREGAAPVEESPNLYTYDEETGGLKFVATLGFGDFADWESDERPVQTTTDGRYLAFTSRAAIAGATGEARQIFEYDAERQTLVHVSRNQNGFAGVGAPDFATSLLSPGWDTSPTVSTSHLEISNTGAVAFQSSAELTPGALNHQLEGEYSEQAVFAQNLYLFENDNVYLVSDGKDAALQPEGFPRPERAGIELVGMDSSGANLFFRTSDALSPEQEDSQWNLYDARIDGGFVPSVAVPTCRGEECRGPSAGPPTTPTPVTPLVPGGGNLTPSAPMPAKPLTRAERLKRALKACSRYRSRSRHAKCTKNARKAYGPRKEG